MHHWKKITLALYLFCGPALSLSPMIGHRNDNRKELSPLVYLAALGICGAMTVVTLQEYPESCVTRNAALTGIGLMTEQILIHLLHKL